MYKNLAELLEAARTKDCSLWRVVLDNELALGGLDEATALRRLDERLEVMRASSERALNEPCHTVGGLIEGTSCTQQRHAQSGQTLSGGLINRVMARALSCSEVNAAMGRICAAPTAGACGILPAVLFSLAEARSLDQEALRRGLLTASGVGAIIMKNATVSGAEGGCQAECGVAAAMAAAAAVELAGGSREAAVESVALALMNCMGLVCDPVAGLVQVPCAQRNASQAVGALAAADLALGGMRSVIPADEMIDAMLRVGRMMPMPLKETALGGIAASPTGKAIAKQIFGEEGR